MTSRQRHYVLCWQKGRGPRAEQVAELLGTPAEALNQTVLDAAPQVLEDALGRIEGHATDDGFTCRNCIEVRPVLDETGLDTRARRSLPPRWLNHANPEGTELAMSTRRERAKVIDMAVDAWNIADKLLTEIGETWPDIHPDRWPPAVHLAVTEARTIIKVLEVIGGPHLSDIIELHRDRKRAAEAEPDTKTVWRYP